MKLGLGLGMTPKRGGGRAPYQGLVAAGIPSTMVAFTSTVSSSRTPMTLTEAVGAANPMRLVFAGAFNGVAFVNSISMRCAIEYGGATYPVFFSGARDVTININATVISDAFSSVEIPAGASFYFRATQTGAKSFRNLLSGSAMRYDTQGASTADTDLTGALAGSPIANQGYLPHQVIASTTKPTYALVGDSVMYGFKDISSSANARTGIIARFIPSDIAFINLGISGSNTSNWYSTAGNLKGLIQYTSNVVGNHGVNFSDSIATIDALYANAEFTGKTIWQCTLTPRVASSSDGYTTLAGQTLRSGADLTVMNAINSGLRAGSSTKVAKVLDVNPPLVDPTVITNCAWQAPSGVALTDDGVHPGVGSSGIGYIRVFNADFASYGVPANRTPSSALFAAGA